MFKWIRLNSFHETHRFTQFIQIVALESELASRHDEAASVGSEIDGEHKTLLEAEAEAKKEKDLKDNLEEASGAEGENKAALKRVKEEVSPEFKCKRQI